MSDEEAERRVDSAIDLIAASQFIYPIGLSVSGGVMRDAFPDTKIKSPNRKPVVFEPDFLCFLGYAMRALEYVSRKHPDCEKLDFLIERNGKITEYIGNFHAGLGEIFVRLGRPELAKMVGDLLPVGKDRLPVQAADVLCWHSARAHNPSSMDYNDEGRCIKLSKKKGWFSPFSREDVMLFADSMKSK